MNIQTSRRFLAKLAARRSRRAAVGLLALTSTFLAGQSTRAVTYTWSGAGDNATWNLNTNWTPNTAFPNAITDTAVFNAGSAAIALGVPITVQNIQFTGAPGAFTLGVNGGNNFILRGTGAGSGGAGASFNNSISLAAAVTSAEVVAAPLSFSAPSSTSIGYAFVNNSTTAAATLTLSGAITTATANNRFTSLQLDGTNTGNNTISGVITSGMGATSAGQGNVVLNKVGTGRWILSGANLFTGAGITNVAQGINVNAGTLVAGNNQAFGTSATANNNQVNINSGGTVEIAAGILLDNAVSLNLNNGGTILSNGSATTNGRINVGTAAGTNVTISTANAADVFTIGNGANDLTGGAADSVINVAGPGTVFTAQASTNYLGGFSINAGTLRVGSSTNGLGVNGVVAFGANSTGRLQLNANSVALTSLNTNAATPGSAIIENGTAGASTLTVNNAAANTFAGVIQNGAAGTLTLTKGGAGTLTLGGANTYTGATTIGAGTLNVTGSLGNTAVAVNATGTLAGSGTITGTATVASTGAVSPGNGGSGTIGTLTLGGLTLNAGSQLNFDVTNPSTLDQILVTGANGLTINGGTFNLNGGANAFTTNGVYNLIGYNGAIGGTGVSALTLNANNQSTATNSYTLGTSGGFVTLTIASTGGVVDYYNKDADGVWSDPTNWTAGVPNAVGAFASFGGGGVTITAPRTVTVDGAFTVGTLGFNSAQAFTLVAGAGGSLTLDNGASTAFVSDTAGSHNVAVPLIMTANGANFQVSGLNDTLNVTGVVSGGGTGLVKSGAGTLFLGGVNTYTGGTSINAGTLAINSADSMGDASGTTTINAGTLRTTADTTSGRAFTVGDAASTISVATGTTYTLNGIIGGGGVLNKAGSGTLTLNGTNTYTGGTVINAGTVAVNSANSLGDVSGVATINAGTLEYTIGFTTARNFTLGSATSTIQTDVGVTTLATGVFSGSGALNKTGAGTLTLTGANNYAGSTVLTGGVISVGNGGTTGSLGAGTAVFQGGTLTNSFNAGTSLFFPNAISVAAGQTGTINMGNRMTLSGAVTGAGTLNINANTTLARDDFSNNFVGFTGQLNVAGSGNVRLLNNGGAFNTAGLANASVDVSGNAFLAPITNSTGNTYLIGALSGSSATAGFVGGSAGTATISVGALNTSTTFAGTFNGNDALTKTGTGTLTLTGNNVNTGTTTVSGGVLAVGNGGTLGNLGTGSVSNNGTLVFNRSDAVTVNNAISGNGTVAITGPGTTTFTNQLGAGTGAVAGILARAGTTVFDTGSFVATAAFSSIGPAAGETATLTVRGSAAWFANGDINVGDSGTVASPATGTLNIQDTAGVNISAGGLFVGSAFFAGTSSAVGTVNQSGGTLTNGVTTAGSFLIGGRGDSRGTGTYNLTGGSASSAGQVYVGNLGTGTLNISGDAATSTFTASAGLRVGNASTAVGVVNLDGGTLTTTAVDTGTITASSTFNFNGGTLTAAGSNTSFFQGLTTANVRNGGARINDGGSSITIAQALLHSTIGGDNATDGGLTKSGSGTVTLTGLNTYTGATTISGGTLQVGDGTTNGSIATSSSIVNNGALIYNRPTGSTSTYANVISGGGSLTKTGAGTQLLTGANTFTGGTIINAGALLVDNATGSGTGTGAVLVTGTGLLGGGNGASTGGVLPGTFAGGATSQVYPGGLLGVVSGTVTVNSGATLAPGNSVGTLTLGGLTLDAGSLLSYEFNNAANDFTSVTGVLTLNGGAFSLFQEGSTNPLLAQGVYNLFSYGSLVGSINNLTVGNPQAGYTYTFVDNPAANLIQLQVVPEPSTWAMMIGGLGVLVGLQRFRRQRA